MIRKVILLVAVALACSSCTSIMYRMYGIELLDEFNTSLYEKTVASMTDKYEGTLTTVVSSDSLFRVYLEKFEELDKKNLSQPIQMLYFEGDSLVSYHANCFAKSSMLNGNLNWNHAGYFDSFNPRSAIEVDSISAGLTDLLSIYELTAPSENFTVVYFWSNMLNRQSKGGYTTIISNISEHFPKDEPLPNIFLINTDDFYINLGVE